MVGGVMYWEASNDSMRDLPMAGGMNNPALCGSDTYKYVGYLASNNFSQDTPLCIEGHKELNYVCCLNGEVTKWGPTDDIKRYDEAVAACEAHDPDSRVCLPEEMDDFKLDQFYWSSQTCDPEEEGSKTMIQISESLNSTISGQGYLAATSFAQGNPICTDSTEMLEVACCNANGVATHWPAENQYLTFDQASDFCYSIAPEGSSWMCPMDWLKGQASVSQGDTPTWSNVTCQL
jgi:hypothetical protein